MDWQALLYGPIYATLGVEATLTIEGTDGVVVSTGADGGPLLVLDKTAGVVTGNGGGRFQAEVQTLTPAAAVRAADLAGVERDRLHGAAITFNGKTWKIDTPAFRPSPGGEADGEILLLLTER